MENFSMVMNVARNSAVKAAVEEHDLAEKEKTFFFMKDFKNK